MTDSRTQSTGVRTGRISKTAIANKSEDHDYAFKRKIDVEAGTVGQEGWAAVQGQNAKETWYNPHAKAAHVRTKGGYQLPLDDTVLCKRTKEASQYFTEIHNDKRRAQARLIREATNNNRRALQGIDPDAKLKGGAQISGMHFTQKVGPNQEVS